MTAGRESSLLVLNQMAGPLTRELVEDYAARGRRVQLLTGHPDTLAQAPAEGVELHRAPTYRRRSYRTRIVSWLCYLLKASCWLLGRSPRIPALYFSNPPLGPWLGYVERKLRGRRYSIMVHDIYPDVLTGLGRLSPRHPVVRLWRAINRRVYENADVVMTLGDEMAARLVDQFDPTRTPAGRVPTIFPWADVERIRPRDKQQNDFARQHDLIRKTTIMYSGNMGLGHDLETMIEAAIHFREQPDVRFVFIGAGPKWELVDRLTREHALDNVTVLGWQPEETLPYSLSAADIAVVSLEEGIEGLALPSKAFSFLAAGAALLVIASGRSELNAIVDRYDCGWSIRPRETERLIELIEEARAGSEQLERRKRNSRRTAESVGSRANTDAIIDLVNRAATPARTAAP